MRRLFLWAGNEWASGRKRRLKSHSCVGWRDDAIKRLIRGRTHKDGIVECKVMINRDYSFRLLARQGFSILVVEPLLRISWCIGCRFQYHHQARLLVFQQSVCGQSNSAGYAGSWGRALACSVDDEKGNEEINRLAHRSKDAPGFKIYPNLLKGLKIEIANQIWSTGITNILMARGFIHLPQLRKCSFTGSCASQINYVGDKILYWDLTGSIRTSWTTWDLKYEQASRFTSSDFNESLQGRGISIGMDDEGTWRAQVDKTMNGYIIEIITAW